VQAFSSVKVTTDFDVLIVGAGVAGSSAAILLAQAGWSVGLIEKRRFPRRKVCGECVSASNLSLIDALGIGESFGRLAGAPLRRVALFAGEDRFITNLPRFDDPAHPWARALGREHLDTLLLQRAAALGVQIWQPWTVRKITHATEHDGMRHTCQVQALHSSESAQLSAPILIDAHGSWEAYPHHSGKRQVSARSSDLFAFKGNFAGAELDADLLPVLAFPGGYGGMVLTGDGLLTLACCIRRDVLQAIRGPGRNAATAVQAYLQASCLGVRHALRNAHQNDAWLGAGPIRPGIRSPALAPNVFAIGNAAGEAHPILGEGMSMAIQSAFVLCEHLIPRRAGLLSGKAGSSAIGRAYASEWRRSFASRIRVAAVLSHLAMRPAAGVVLRPLLRRWPGILTATARIGGKTRCAIDARAPIDIGGVRGPQGS
jgi:flavin-dependent dehydrogenase